MIRSDQRVFVFEVRWFLFTMANPKAPSRGSSHSITHNVKHNAVDTKSKQVDTVNVCVRFSQ